MGWWWALVVAVGLLGALAVLGGLAWSAVRAGIAVAGEAGRAAERLGELAGAVERLPAAARPAPAVFDDPAVLRAERARRLARTRSARLRARKRARGAAKAAQG